MIEIIPAIDIIDGKCVRLSQGDYDSKKVYNENPVEVAKEFEANGVRREPKATENTVRRFPSEVGGGRAQRDGRGLSLKSL